MKWTLIYSLNSLKKTLEALGFKIICDQKVSLAEVDKCIGSLKDNKSPGSDGLIN